MGNQKAHCEPDTQLSRRNLRAARARWGASLDSTLQRSLRTLSEQLGISIELGDLLLLQQKWYISHSGLLRLARRNRCSGIQTETISEFCDPRAARWVIKATVYKSPRSKGFAGYGDADPTNVSPLVRGAEMRIAETRAVNRALRKAYGIGLCSVEELGAGPTRIRPEPPAGANGNNGDGQPRLRDRLLLLIRQHHLDTDQVKRYATHFCGTNSLREASREQVEKFVNHLAARAADDREMLIAEMASINVESEVDSEPETAANRHRSKEAA